jgi:hypothetical protein
MRLDDRLRRGLARRPAPDGFAARAMVRIALEERRGSHDRSGWAGTLVLRRIAAAAILALLLGGLAVRELDSRKRAAEGERARREVMTAFHIASAKIRAAQHEVQKVASTD